MLRFLWQLICDFWQFLLYWWERYNEHKANRPIKKKMRAYQKHWANAKPQYDKNEQSAGNRNSQKGPSLDSGTKQSEVVAPHADVDPVRDSAEYFSEIKDRAKQKEQKMENPTIPESTNTKVSGKFEAHSVQLAVKTGQALASTSARATQAVDALKTENIVTNEKRVLEKIGLKQNKATAMPLPPRP
jgi:hypothetical protein